MMPLIVLPGAGTDRGLFLLAAALLERRTARPLLLGRREDHQTTAEILGIDLGGARFLFPTDDPITEELVTFLRHHHGPPAPDQLRASLLASEELYSLALTSAGRADAILLPAGAESMAGTEWASLADACAGRIVVPPPGPWNHQAVLEAVEALFP